MPQSLVQIYVHVVFSTKDRKRFLADRSLRERLHAYLAAACDAQNCRSIQVGGVEDHVHLLIRLGKTIDIATLILELKRESSKWVKAESPTLRSFYWQSGYAAFSISPAHVDALATYIKNQEEHHRRESFQDELRRICMKCGVEIDERYVWQ